MTITARLHRESVDGTATQEIRIGHPAKVLINEYEIDSQIDATSATLDSRMDGMTSEGSGWKVDELLNFDIHIAAYDTILGSSCIPYHKRQKHRR